MLSTEDLLWFVDEALSEMVAIVRDLGDDLANERPTFANSNSPYVILTHCLGVMEWWGGHIIAGRDDHRDRVAEFTAKGDVEELANRAIAAFQTLEHDVIDLDPERPLANTPSGSSLETPYGSRSGAVCLHIYEELAQHLGQMQITRDIIEAAHN